MPLEHHSYFVPLDRQILPNTFRVTVVNGQNCITVSSIGVSKKPLIPTSTRIEPLLSTTSSSSVVPISTKRNLIDLRRGIEVVLDVYDETLHMRSVKS